MEIDLSPATIAAQLATRWLGRPCNVEPVVDSTNTALADQARRGGTHGTVLVADSQTRGRGRHAHSWHSPAGLNLYFSLLLRPGWSPRANPPISLAAGIALAEVAAVHLPDPPHLKWPNDLLYRERKLAGILVEGALQDDGFDYVIVGIGLNVNQLDFPASLSATAGSLRQMSGQELPRAELLASLLNRLEKWLDTLNQGDPRPVLTAWLRFAPWIGTPIRVKMGAKEIAGTALGLTDEGALRIRDASGGECVVHTGEVLDI